MRDPFALMVLLLGTGVMAYGFVLTVTTQVAGTGWVLWEVALVLGGLAAACIGGYAVGRSVAEEGAWDGPRK